MGSIRLVAPNYYPEDITYYTLQSVPFGKKEMFRTAKGETLQTRTDQSTHIQPEYLVTTDQNSS